MRIISILTALFVLSGLYFLVFERAAVKAISNGAPLSTLIVGVTNVDGALNKRAEPKIETEKAQTSSPTQVIRVVALQSVQQEIDSAVILGGQTEAAREVQVRAETSGQVVSEPIRKGALVKENQIYVS